MGGNHGTVSNSYATGEVSGVDHVGGLVGWKSDGTVENSYATGDVSGINWIGGLVGRNRGTVENTYAIGDVGGAHFVGGLVGQHDNRNDEATVENSYATGDVSGDRYVGGLVGRVGSDDLEIGGEVINSYSTGEVSGNDDDTVGGLIGLLELGEVNNSFWDIDSSGQEESDGGTGKSTAEMKAVSTYTNISTEGLDEPWDFVGNPYDDEGDEDIWNIDGHREVNDGYPFLDWQDLELDKFEITIDSTEGGVVVIPGEGTFKYEQRSEVEIEAIPDENYRFAGWNGDTESIDDVDSNSTKIEMLEDYEITAEFAPVEHELEIKVEGEGITEPEEGTHIYEHGEEVTITADPDEGWAFTNWTGNVPEGEEEENTITVIMDNDKEITAVFEEEEDEDDDIPGFTSTLLLLAMVMAVAIYRKKD